MKHLALLAAFALPVWAAADTPKPPPTRTDNVRETIHGVEIVDPYRWLEDQNSPETRAWIAEQQKYAEAVLGKLPGREAIRRRLTELMRTETMSAPSVHNGLYFFSRRQADQDMPVFYVRKGFSGPDEVLLDCNTLSPDKTVSAGTLDVSEDGSLWVYGIRQGGEDEVLVKFKEVASRHDLPDTLPRARYSGVQVKADKSGLYYSVLKPDGPRVYYHVMGKPTGEDTEIFGKGLSRDKIIGISMPEDGKYLLLTVLYGSAARKSEIYVKDVAADGPITPVVNDIDARFTGRIGGDTLFLQTNWKAPNNRLLAVRLKEPARDKWKEVVPEGKNVMQGFGLVGGRVYVSYLENVSSAQKIYLPDGTPAGEVKFPGIGTGGVNGRWDRDEAFFSFSNFVTPPTVWRYFPDKGIAEVWSRQCVPFQSDNYEVKQVRYKSKDGTEIPMFLVYKKGLEPDGNNPAFLTGYGGFNLSRTPSFSASVALWVERGGVYALPSLRGGGEFGEAWHQAGMLEKKQNVFDDFIGAAEWLIKERYTRPEKLAISGGSNGGLLVGAALTQRPDLFRAVVCSVPLLDMIRYHKFLVARYWVPEYGSSEDPEQFKYIYAYSPYHHVKKGEKYPGVLFMTGDSDTRVAPLHARKMCALLQASTASGPDRPILLHYDTKAGHSGGKPVTKQIEDAADEFAFLFWQLGVKPGG